MFSVVPVCTPCLVISVFLVRVGCHLLHPHHGSFDAALQLIVSSVRDFCTSRNHLQDEKSRFNTRFHTCYVLLLKSPLKVSFTHLTFIYILHSVMAERKMTPSLFRLFPWKPHFHFSWKNKAPWKHVSHYVTKTGRVQHWTNILPTFCLLINTTRYNETRFWCVSNCNSYFFAITVFAPTVSTIILLGNNKKEESCPFPLD